MVSPWPLFVSPAPPTRRRTRHRTCALAPATDARYPDVMCAAGDASDAAGQFGSDSLLEYMLRETEMLHAKVEGRLLSERVGGGTHTGNERSIVEPNPRIAPPPAITPPRCPRKGLKRVPNYPTATLRACVRSPLATPWVACVCVCRCGATRARRSCPTSPRPRPPRPRCRRSRSPRCLTTAR